MAVLDDLVATSQRYRRWKEIQSRTLGADSLLEREARATMQADRMKFSGTRFARPDSSVFLESIIEGDDLMPIRYFEMGKLAAKPVGRIQIDLGPRVGQAYATGFLVAPGILLTNHHVIRSADHARAATVTFDAEDDLQGLPRTPKVFLLDPESLFINDEALDYCFVAVADRGTDGTPIRDFGFLRLFAGTGKIMRDEFATIIQHPRGRQKQVAARNNRIAVYVYDKELENEDEKSGNNYIYYATDTMAGSSGAPVFSDQWFVVALHRRGVPKLSRNGKRVLRRGGGFAREDDPDEVIAYEANEGVRVSRIMKSVRAIAGQAGTLQASAHRVADAIDEVTSRVEDGPFWIPTAERRTVTGAPAVIVTEGLEVVRRKTGAFADAPGYDEDFLRGLRVALPELSSTLRRAAAPRIDEPETVLLPFRHFSTVMHATRRLPIYAAVNIDGAKMPKGKMPKRPAWSYDPRLADEHQPDDSIFSDMVQRGHMAAREFIYWGDSAEEIEEADRHSFTLTNVCPQIDTFNGRLEWYKLERLIVSAAEIPKRRISCFMGPIFGRDRLYDDLRSENSGANFDTGIRLPNRFWYVMVWSESGQAKHRAFLLDQSDDIDAKEDGLEVDFDVPATVKEVTLSVVEEKAKLTFKDLH